MNIEDNRMIADFMEWQHHENKEYDDYEMNVLQYHSSFDWLMAVVEKLESLGYSFWFQHTHERNTNHITIWSSNKIIVKHEAIIKLEATYAAVIQFIKYYNEHIKNN